jgi:hypothetical protein
MELPDYTVARVTDDSYGRTHHTLWVKGKYGWTLLGDRESPLEEDREFWRNNPDALIVALPTDPPVTLEEWRTQHAWVEDFKESRRNFVPGLYDAGLNIEPGPPSRIPADFRVMFQGKQTVHSILTHDGVAKLDPPVTIQQSGVYAVQFDDNLRPVGLQYLHPWRDR